MPITAERIGEQQDSEAKGESLEREAQAKGSDSRGGGRKFSFGDLLQPKWSIFSREKESNLRAYCQMFHGTNREDVTRRYLESYPECEILYCETEEDYVKDPFIEIKGL